MFRPMPTVGLGRRWHVLSQQLHGFALVAPPPCGFVQAAIQCEQATTTLEQLAARASASPRACAVCPIGIRPAA